MKLKILLTWVVSVWFAASAIAQNNTQQVTAIQYYFDTDPGVGVAGNGAILAVTPTANYNQTVSITVPGSLSQGFHNLYVRAKDEFGKWSLPERRLFYINTATSTATQDIIAYQYYFDTDPGVGVAGNGAIVPVTQTSNYNASVNIAVPGSLTTGFHNLYVRTQDVLGRWSLIERRLFYINNATSTATQDIVAYQYYFDTDPGVGVAGNGAIVPVTQTANYNASVSITVPGSLTTGFHNLYVRTQDALGRWSLIERRLFYINTATSTATQDIVAYQYYFDTDPGVGVAGNGAIVPVTQTGNYNASVSIAIPGSLTTGFHNLYVRTQDALGRWSLIERRLFYINTATSTATQDIVAYQYYFDTDPGVGVAGNGAIVPVTQTGNYNASVSIAVPGSLATGFHNLYVRTQDVLGRWSLIERRLFYINTGTSTTTQDITALEYYYDNDPGVGNGNPIAVTTSANINATFPVNVPCLSTGTHYLYIRAKDVLGRWSIIERDTVFITSGISAAVVTPAGPIAICSPGSVTLSADSVAGLTYQWLLDGNDITGATSHTYEVTAAGNYSLKTTCGSSFVTSNIVSVNIVPNLTPSVSISITTGSNPSCSGNVTFTATPVNGGTSPSYQWKKNANNVGSNSSIYSDASLINGDVIECVMTSSETCANPGSAGSNQITMAVQPPAIAGTVSGTTPLCIGVTTFYSSNGDAGGVWSSSNNGVATVNTTGLVTAIGAGNTDIIYTVNTGCGSPVSSSMTLVVNPNVNAGIISGTTPLCIGATATFTSNGDAGGIWSSTNNSTATVNSTNGLVTALSPGTANITYTINTGCASPSSSILTLTINPSVNAGTVSGTTPLSIGAIATYTSNGDAGGVWSSSNTSVATVVANTGVVTAVDVGTTNISYAISTGCGSPISAFQTLIVNPTNAAGTVSGLTPLCIGATATYSSNGDPGGTWTSTNTGVATVHATSGLVTALSAGTTDITYTISPGVSAFKTLTVSPNNSNAGTVTGASNICIGASTLFSSNGTAGGSWSSSNPAIATVTPLTGLVSGLGTGSATIIYTVTGCTGTLSSSRILNVSAPVTAGILNGPSLLCIGETLNFTSSGTTGGTWSSNDNNIATVNSTTGLVTALSAGTVSINYTIAGCNGSSSASRIATVISVASAGTVTGASSLCAGATANYGSTGIAGGAWSSSNTAVATINVATGQAQALSSGTTNIIYTVTACNGTFSSTRTLTVGDAVNAGIVSGTSQVCVGDVTTFSSNGTPGGTWSSSNTTVATVNISTGVITTLSAGTITITYQTVAGCNGTLSSSRILTVNSVTSAGNISGVSPICIGSSATYSTNGTSGGIWSSSNPGIATVDPSTGVVTGISSGSLNIEYTITGCQNTFTSSQTVLVAGHLPALSFSGNINFITSVVAPAEGLVIDNYRFEIKYTHVDGELPAPGYPRMALTGPKNYNVIMSPANVNDVDVTDGKIYYVVLSGLKVGDNYSVNFLAKTSGGCELQSQSFPGPKISAVPELSIFANDITFSNNTPAVSSTITVSAVIHNDAASEIENFIVHLINQYDLLAVYPDILVPSIDANSSVTVSWSITTPSLNAWVPMQVVIDYTNVIDETNELDNQAIRPFVNGNFVVPGNIHLTANTQTPICQGSFTTVCGNATYQNTAVVLQDPSVAGATVTARVVETGQEFSGYTDSQGNYCISVFGSNIIGTYSLELSLTDFTITGLAAASFSIVACPPPDGPDLVSEIILATSEIFPGDPITGTVKISNHGNQPAGLSTAHVYLSSTGTASALQMSTPALAPGAFHTEPFSFISPLTSGSETVNSKADINGTVTELNEVNNTDYKNIRICPILPELVGGHGSNWYPVTGVYLCENNFSYGIYNPSCLPVNDPFNVLIEVFQNSNLVNAVSRTITQSIPRETGYNEVVNNLFPAAGNYTVKLTVDVSNSIAEYDEGNNVIAKPYVVTECKPDLGIGAGCSPVMTVDPAIPGNINLRTTLSNGGTAVAIAPFVVDFEVAGNHYPLTINSDLPHGSSIQVIGNFPTPPYGCPSVIVTADATNLIDEYNETNTAQIELAWDFKLKRICWSPGEDEDAEPNPNFWEVPHNVGEPVAMKIGLLNLSTYTASLVHTKFEVRGPGITGWLDIGFAFNNNVGQSCGYCSLTPGVPAPIHVSLPNDFVFPEVGIYQVRMTTDFDHRYTECNESNNDTIVEVSISNSPDYRILSQYIAPSLLNPEVGESITVDVTYKNIGVSNIVDSLNILLKVNDLPHQTVRVKGLLSGTTFTAHFSNPWASLIPGLHIIRAVADSQNELPESNELNNAATRSFVVGKTGNLYFQAFYPDNLFPTIGQEIRINARIGNSGALDCEGDVKFFFLDEQLDSVPLGTVHVIVDAGDSIEIQIPWSVIKNDALLIARIVNPSILQLHTNDKEATAQLGSFEISVAAVPACIGGNDGTVTANVSGGSPPFSYLWNTGATNQSVTAPPGIYLVTVTDDEGFVRVGEGRILSIPPPSFYEDADGDGYGNPASIVEECEPPPGYVADNTDCNDGNFNIHPGATEICNGIDDNCNGQIDEGVLLTFYIDEDGDGFGNPDVQLEACSAPLGYVADDNDCNDALVNVHPGVSETCNGLDDNCNGQIDEGVSTTFYRDADGDGYGNPFATTQNCSPPSGYVPDNTDCDDTNNAINPGATEVCNGIDDNCNNQIDEGLLIYTYYADVDGDGYGNASNSITVCVSPSPPGYTSDNTDCDDSRVTVHSLQTYFVDADLDGYGSTATAMLCSSVAPFGYSATSNDCDDGNNNIYPGATENCENAIDDNCNLQVDEGCFVQEYCTYSQGHYGNVGGLTCSGLTTAQAILQALNSPVPPGTCNPIVVGYGTKTLTIPCTNADINCLMQRLPGSGPSAALPINGNTLICNANGNTWLKNGKFKNTLLGQTIALSLNLRLSPDLGNLSITSPVFTTYASTSCVNGSAVAGTGLNFTIPQNVITCLGQTNNKVSDLLALANKKLGSVGNCSSVSFGEITNALNAVNLGFDRCRILLENGFLRLDAEADDEQENNLVIYPNPATQTISFYANGKEGVFTLQVINMLGQNIIVREIELNGTDTYSMDISALTPGIYKVVLQNGSGLSMGTVVKE